MSRSFVPAAGLDFLLPFYDPLWRLLGGQSVRATFISDAGLAPGQRILDIGCGTGSLPVQIAQMLPGTQIRALDPDPKALARGKDKAARAGVDIDWNEGFGEALPFEDAVFDRVVSSFMFHHLALDMKQAMLREARRVLTSGGELHLIDFGGQHEGKDSRFARLLHPHNHIVDNLGGRIGELFEEAGFKDVGCVSEHKSIFGRFQHMRGAAF